ncbi:MAG: energy-coupling factor transporter transmembrane protein EcfT [Ruminococcaceae bacterium]|nr:energy-coupling factor transporter transmembrane protein EcfT [Oscillospiraceae bacterium]
MKSIALGQFYPSESVLHRLDPRIKVILTILYIVCSFLCKNIVSFALLLLSALVLILLGRIPLKVVLRGLRPVLIILIFTAFLNIFWTKGEHLLFGWKFIQIYTEGLYAAVFIIIRITALIIGTSMLLTYTTTPIALTDAIEDLLLPLKKLHVPVHEFAMMMTIALRFIPTLVEETDKIMTAQKARGADFSTGSLIDRTKALIPILIPLFVSAFNRAGDLATAMECRCYHGGEGRTRMTVRHVRFADFIPLVLLLLLGAALIVFNIVGIGYTM